MAASVDLYELLIRSVVDYAIYMLDPEGKVVSWNPGAERAKGYTAEEIIGVHFSRFYTEEERAAGVPQNALKIAAETGRFATEGWRVRKDGIRFWAMVVIDPIRQNGKLIGFAKITRDMTEQRAAQLAVLESERRFRLLVQGVTDYAIFMLDPEGRVTNWNTGAERIKGYKASEIVGRHFSTFYTPEDAKAGVPTNALEKARRQGRYEAEGWRVRKDGSHFWAGVVLDAIYDDDGTLIGFAKITRDLTERRETQLQLEPPTPCPSCSACCGPAACSPSSCARGRPKRARAMHPVSLTELERLARECGAMVIHTAETPDQMGRPNVTWTGIALRLPDDGTGALALAPARHSQRPEKRDLQAWIVSLCRVADGQAGAGTRRKTAASCFHLA